MIYFFKIGELPAIAHDVELEGLLPESAQTDLHKQILATKFAKALNHLSGTPVKFYPKGKPENMQMVEFDYSGGSETSDGQEIHIGKDS